MAKKESTTTSSPKAGAKSSDAFRRFRDGLDELEKLVGTARKNGFKVTSHRFYAPKAWNCLAMLRKNLLLLKAEFQLPDEAGIVSELCNVEELLGQVDLDGEAATLLRLVGSLKFRLDSDVAAALHARRNGRHIKTAPFLPPDILPNGVYRRVLEEANKCFEQECYNACAAMLRRLIESLIIEAFEAHGIEDKIKLDGEYQQLNSLIGKAAAEPELRLGRNTAKALPQLKFFGDLSLHGRRNLVRKDDLDRLHAQTRVAIEELADRAFKA